MDNAQRRNICTSVPSSQTFRSYSYFLSPNLVILVEGSQLDKLIRPVCMEVEMPDCMAVLVSQYLVSLAGNSVTRVLLAVLDRMVCVVCPSEAFFLRSGTRESSYIESRRLLKISVSDR
jgi:hypothetical protein